MTCFTCAIMIKHNLAKRLFLRLDIGCFVISCQPAPQPDNPRATKSDSHYGDLAPFSFLRSASASFSLPSSALLPLRTFQPPHTGVVQFGQSSALHQLQAISRSILTIRTAPLRTFIRRMHHSDQPRSCARNTTHFVCYDAITQSLRVPRDQ
jgi:hypothetical protein